MKKLFNYLLISNIFTGSFVFSTGYGDFYVYYIFMAGFLLGYAFFYRKINFPRNFLYILAVIFFFSLINIFQGNDSVARLFKVTFGFILNGLTYYLLIRINGYKVDGLFRIYLRIACVVALIGIFQEISYLVGFESGYDYRPFIPRIVLSYVEPGILRVTSIIQEPAHYGAVLAPAMFVSILNIMRKENYFISKKMSYLIVASVLLTFSFVAYVGIIVAFILIMLNYRRFRLICMSAIILFVFMFISYRYIPSIQKRADQTVAVINGGIPLDAVNLSTFSFCSNGLVALKSFMHNPLFGAGIGSHPLSYDKYISQIVDQNLNKNPPINREDANSLFFRIISETGLLGVFSFLYFIFRFYVSKRRDGYYWIISNSIVCLFVLNLLRQGNYFYGGFIFFVWVYYFTSKNISGANAIESLKKI